MNNIDVILYDKGDIVIRKNKSKDLNGDVAKKEKVFSTRIIEGDSYYYQIIYFESNPESAHVAYEYEPYDKEQRKAYYDTLKTFKDNNIRRKTSSKAINKGDDNDIDKPQTVQELRKNLKIKFM